MYEWKDRFVDIRLNIEEEMDKLESFSRRNNIHLFNVYQGPFEENAACVREEVQYLTRFYWSSKTWTADDVERAHRTVPKTDNCIQPSPPHPIPTAQMAGQVHGAAIGRR